MYSFNLRGEIVDCIDIDANPNLGFHFPFRIIIPKNINKNPEVVYACNLPKDESDKCNSFDEMIELAKKDLGSIDPMHIHLCLEKGYPMIIPAVPRTKNFRPNFLGRDCFKNDFSSHIDSKFKDDLYKYNDLPLQHKKIIEHAIKCLHDNDINVDDRVIIAGYSEGSKFASHLALLHPEVIKAVIAGGTSGVMSMPISNILGYELKYPLGIADFQNFNKEDFQRISFFYYMGQQDKADPAIPYFDDVYYVDENGETKVLVDECNNKTPMIDENGNQVFKMDENGNYMAKFPLFSDEEVNTINKILGTVIQERFKNQKQIYKDSELISEFHFYPGNHKTIFDKRDEIFEDVDNFIANNLIIDKKTKVV